MTPSGIENTTFRLVMQICYRLFSCVVTTPNSRVYLSVSLADSIVTTVASVYRKTLFLVMLCLEDDVCTYCKIDRQATAAALVSVQVPDGMTVQGNRLRGFCSNRSHPSGGLAELNNVSGTR